MIRIADEFDPPPRPSRLFAIDLVCAAAALAGMAVIWRWREPWAEIARASLGCFAGWILGSRLFEWIYGDDR